MEKKFVLELHETSFTGRLLKVVIGIASAVAAVWFIINIKGSEASVTTAWIAVAFLFLFAIWLIISGLGLAERYITIDGEKLVVRDIAFKRPVTFVPGEIESMLFKPLRVDIIGKRVSRSIRLGTYYPEQSESLMEALRRYCEEQGVPVNGLV